MTASPIDVIEAAYRLEGTDLEWLESVARAVRPLLDGGRGLTAYFYDAAQPVTTWLARRVDLDIAPATQRRFTELYAAHPSMPAVYHRVTRALESAVGAYRRLGFGELFAHPTIAAAYRELGVGDFATLRTIEPGGRSIAFVAGQVEERAFAPRTAALWARVASHIAAGRRLREAIASSQGAVTAVMTPAGKVEHADGAAPTRDVLRDAVRRREHARGRARRRDPEAATVAWTALVSGTWSLVDQFERGGRRYVVARRNEHGLTDPRALTPRERAVAHLAALGNSNKLISYELGLSESTVATHLMAAMRKLGMRSRAELIRALAGLP